MSKQYLLGIDNGGSDIKCALFDTKGNEISSCAMQVSISTLEEGFTERDSEEVWQANLEAIRKCIKEADIDPEDIQSIGITAYGNGLVFVDENIKPVYPIIVSTDNRTEKLVQEFKDNGTERKLFPHTRQTLWSAQPAVLLPWFERNRKDVLNKTRWILSLKDYLRYKLTSDLHGEITEASSTSLFDQDKRDYEYAIFEILGIEDCYEKMPKVLNSTDIAGYVNKETAALTGLKEGTPVAAGYFDIDANALASGILDDEQLCLIAGTWSINEFLTKEAARDYDLRTNTATISYLPGHFLMEDSSPTSAGNFNWYIEKIIIRYGKDLDRKQIYDLCNSMVEECSAFDSNVVFVPFLFGSPDGLDYKAAFFNISADDNDASLVRAIYEGVVFSSVRHVRNLQRPINSYKGARLSGGITNSPVWSQMMADALQIPIQTLEGSQTGAKGAAIGAGIACGCFRDLEDGVEKMVKLSKLYIPNKGYKEIYQKKYERFEAAIEAIALFSGKCR